MKGEGKQDQEDGGSDKNEESDEDPNRKSPTTMELKLKELEKLEQER